MNEHRYGLSADNNEPIVRIPIMNKLCDCKGSTIKVVDGVTAYRDVTKCTLADLEELLDSREMTLRLYIDATKTKNWIHLLNIAVLRSIPVTLKTNTLLNKHTIDKLHRCENNQIIFSLSSLDSNISEVLDGATSPLSSVLSMMSYAKAMRVHVLTEVQYRPELYSTLDLFELLDALKNFSSMIHLVSDPIPAELMENQISACYSDSELESINRLVKKLYYPDIRDRSWHLKNSKYDTLMESLKSYLKGRKLTYRGVHNYDDRKSTKGSGSHGMGMKPRVYVKSEGSYKPSEDMKSCKCDDCSGMILFGFED